MKNIVLIIGTRPQIIKSAPIISRVKEYPDINLSIIHTGQHYDYEMSKVFFNELNLPNPYLNLNVGSGTSIFQITLIMQKLEQYLPELKPDAVIVPGDTNSTLAGALAAVKMGIPVIHIEAGARSWDRTMPEEMNRVIVDHCASRNLAVSNRCKDILIAESIPLSHINVVGDTMYESIINHTNDIINVDIHKYGVHAQKYIFFTLHRQENIENPDRLRAIIEGIGKLNKTVVFTIHPHTEAILKRMNMLSYVSQKFSLFAPLPYFDTLALVKNADVVLTDSGGLQKECYWLKTPCGTLRDTTEWMETVKVGANRLLDADPHKIEIFIMSAKGFRFGDSDTDTCLLIPDASKRILDDISGGNYKI